MPHGYNGKILHVNLNDLSHEVEEPSENFYRTYFGGGGIAANAADLPPSNGGAFSLETGWGSGGTPGFYGGFGRANLTDLSGSDYFNFWINPDAGQDYTLEINLQDDDDGDDGIEQVHTYLFGRVLTQKRAVTVYDNFLPLLVLASTTMGAVHFKNKFVTHQFWRSGEHFHVLGVGGHGIHFCG